MTNNNQQAFFELVRAGLWEKEIRLSQYKDIDYDAILQLAEEQSVVGLVTAGLEKVVDVKVPQEWVLQFVGETLQIEQQNKSMNQFLAGLVDKLRKADIYAILVKGQGIAQCYEKPLWRASGDVDLLLDAKNYDKAKAILTPLTESVEPEDTYCKHFGMKIFSWVVELHGSLHTELSSRIDKNLDEIQFDTIASGNVRSWDNGNVTVFLPEANNDILFEFTHFLKHFYKGGLGLRQICDWCRLLWTYRKTIDVKLLEKRLRDMRLMTEWKAFSSFVVEYLGMPIDSMPFYSQQKKWSRKANGICSFILEVGNMGHSRDLRFYGNKSFIRRKIGAFGVRVGDLFRHTRLFPLDSIRFFPSIVFNGVRSAIKGVG